MTNIHRLFYEDNKNNLVTIADIDSTTSNTKLQKARLKFRNQAVDKLVAWENSQSNQLFGSLPIKKTSFDADEPELYWQEQRNRLNIQGVDTTNDSFTVSGDHTEDFREGGAVKVENSTGNDGDYTVADINSVSYDSNNDETTINVEQNVSDSTADGQIELWENIFRGYLENQGVITEQGAHKFILYDHSKYTGKRQAGISTAVTTDLTDAMTQTIPFGYSIDLPNSSNVTYVDASGTEVNGYPPIEEYTNTGRITTGYRELTKRYGWALKFRADKTVRFEPIGFGGTVDTISGKADFDPKDATDDSRGTFLEWSKDRLEAINYTQVQVIGTKSDGTEIISDVKENTGLVNDYGEIYESFKVDFNLGSKTEADRIANNIVKDVQNPTEGGRVTVKPRYHTNVSNDSFQLVDSQRGIDAVYTCTEQINYYPENKSELIFQFESEVEKKAENYEGLRGERQRLYPGADQNIDIDFSDFNAQNSTANADNTTNEDDESPATSGDTGFALGDGNYTFEEAGASVLDGASVSVSDTVPNLSTFVEYAMVVANVSFNGVAGNIDITITNNSTNDTYFDRTFNLVQDNTTRTVVALERASVDGDTIQTEVTNNTGNGAEISVDQSVDVIGQHDHTTSGSTDAHNHGVIVTDGGHGAPTDPTTHSLTGDQVQKIIDAINELQTDR